MNNAGVTGLILRPKLILSMREFDPSDSAYAVSLTYDRHMHISNWASEASHTLGCSIEISRDICCRYVVCRMSVVCQINCVGGITWLTRMLKVFWGRLNQ